MKKILGLFIGVTLALALAVSVHAAGGFDQYGYNYTARIFNGPLSGWCNKYYGNTDNCVGTLYEPWANDHLTMKWNAAWDACNAVGGLDASVCTGAWTDNEWNGMMPGGSGETWHYKMVWVGDCVTDSTLVPEGGYCIWNQYAVILSHGTAEGEHLWDALAKPAGYGTYPL